MEDNLKNIKNQYYKDLIEKLSGFLYSVQQEDGTYPGETNYGYTFSALFFAYMEDFKNISYEERIKKFIFSYSSQKKNSLFHWEFNNYALLKLQELKPHLIKNIPWKTNRNNPNTNWRLLKLINFYRATRKKFVLLNLFPILFFRVNKYSLIKDEKSLTRSFQYHTFSTALLGELYLLTGMNFILKTFLNATYFIADKMMPNGRTLYIGRGQEQIFGYSTLLYSLELAQLFLKKNFFEKKITKLLKLLTHFQRKDGSFPLVLNENEKNLSFHQTLSSKALPGWYLYNTIFDYLPFAGVYLFESYRISQNENNNSGKKESFPGMKKEKNSEIVKGKTPTYEFCYAIPTSGKGYYSDELPIPFIVSKEKKDITPIYGGDPYLEKIITPELIPLPYGTLEKSNFKQHLIYWLQFKANLKFSHWGYHLYYSKLRKKDILPFFFANQLRYKKIYNGFSGTNLFITHTRKFNFLKKEITVFDKIVLKRKISFNEFYIINLFVFPGEILRGKNSLIIENTKFTLKIEPIEGDVEFKEQISPLGKLLWIKEKIKQNNKESIYNRKITIILK